MHLDDPPISPEEAQEYREVAALVCMDIDLLLEASRMSDMTLEGLRRHVERAHSKKEELIADAAARRSRFEAVRLLLGLAAAGHIRAEKLDP